MREQFVFEKTPLEVDPEAQGMTRSGRWFRRGRNIVLLLDDKTQPGDGEIYEEPTGGTIPSRKDLIDPRVDVDVQRALLNQWIQKISIRPYDVIDPRIDVGAQKAILRMAKAGPRIRVDAVGMLGAVKSGYLAGIFGDDLRLAAQLAARLGTVRWKLVPAGRDAAFVTVPESRPVIVFRESVRSVPSRLDPALRRAFSAFGIRARSALPVGASLSAANPFFCATWCALCAAAILDGVPGDEFAPCAICLGACIRGSG